MSADYRIDRYKGFLLYHVTGMRMDEIDPAAPMLRYIADNLKLDTEQRLWLAYLYGACYSAPTAYYMFVNLPRIQEITDSFIAEWWQKHKPFLVFESDRLKAKTQNQFPKMLMSYKAFAGDSEAASFRAFMSGSPYANYDRLFEYLLDNLYYFGRFSLFNYLEAVHNLTDLPLLASGVDLKTALSSRNGLCFVLGKDEWVRRPTSGKVSLDQWQYQYLQSELTTLHDNLKRRYPHIPTTYWNLETALCAYKKLFFATRYVGYYIDRQMSEIGKMQKLSPHGADWRALWRFRREHFNPLALGEFNGWNGIRKEKMRYFLDTGRFMEHLDLPSKDYISC